MIQFAMSAMHCRASRFGAQLLTAFTREFLHQLLGFSVPVAKVMNESVLFIGNFAIQRVFIFCRNDPEVAS
jgi:hypothetical protein